MDFNFRASMVLFKENKGSIRDSVNLLASLGCSYLKAGNALTLGEWKDQPEHYLTQEETFEAFLEYIPHYFEDGKPLTIGLEGFFNYDIRRGEVRALNEKDIDESKFSKALMS